MEKVTISRVYVSDKNKDGKEFKDKNGKKFWKVAIQTLEKGENWMSCLCFNADDRVMNLQEGDEVTIVITESNGFTNFSLPKITDLLESRIAALEVRLTKLEGGEKPKTTSPTAEGEVIDPDLIPF